MSSPRPFLFLLASALTASAAAVDISKLPAAAARPVDFVQDIQPLFEKHCLKCHGPEKQKGGWRADVADAALKGGDNYAPNIRPGKSEKSPLIHFVAGLEDDMVMPEKGDRLTAEQIGLLRAWIDQGAIWPEGPKLVDAKQSHWAFQPLTRPALPATAATNPIDAFITAKLAEKQLTLSPEADRRTLIRRLSFNLLGLPPTPEEIEAFVVDPDPRADEKLVDRLLASPHYGERWARHWLDVVRFAESHGFETNRPRPTAWPYRDYVIRSFNEDKSYNQFVREQIAGDALGADEATGFLVGGAWDSVKSPDPVLTAQQRADELHDMVSTTGSAFLGLTVGCARCHNHKFDPISHIDYTAVTAVFEGVRHGERPWRPPDAETRLAQAQKLRPALEAIDRQLAEFQPAAQLHRALLLDDDAPPSSDPARPGVTQIEQPRNGQPITYSPGRERGQADDPGDALRLPNLGESYRYWLVPERPPERSDFVAWEPKLAGRHAVWVSWGVYPSHVADARYVLDRDGDLQTTQDQVEIAKVDQRAFADGSPGPENQRRWSGFREAGVHHLRPESRLVLRAGEHPGAIIADAVVFEEVDEEALAATGKTPHLRPPVSHRANEERFAPTEAKFVRFSIDAASSGEPCLDELEVFTAGATAKNAALASAGTKATASSVYADGKNAKHRLAHINDGRYGNSSSWISGEKGGGWVQLELAEPARIQRVVWSRDRSAEQKIYDDRLALGYRIEVSLDGVKWSVVASSADRLGTEYRKRITTIPTLDRVPREQAAEVARLAQERIKLAEQLTGLSELPPVYAGRFEQPGPTFRLHRGDPMQKKEEVAPGALASFGEKLALAADTPEQQRRVALAEWITDAKNPLTARVLVNRVWHYHFGTGLVDTPSDFGLNGTAPTHPELLDWLASEFIARGWRIKDLHRLILSSATYRQSSAPAAKGLAIDANARLLWRFPPRRLEAEPLRDAILSVSGQLDRRMGGPGFDLFEPNDNYVKIYTSKTAFGAEDFRRMVYQTKPRVQLDDIFGAFDCPDAGQTAPRRTSSTTPLQALNLLNSPFALQQAEFLAARLEKEAGADAAAQTARAFHLAFGRAPAAEETAAATALIGEHGLKVFCRALLNANEFVTIF